MSDYPFSVKRQGIVSTLNPLWAKAIRLRQQNGLNRRAVSSPARSYILIAIAVISSAGTLRDCLSQSHRADISPVRRRAKRTIADKRYSHGSHPIPWMRCASWRHLCGALAI
jgi:hypothetical protein